MSIDTDLELENSTQANPEQASTAQKNPPKPLLRPSTMSSAERRQLRAQGHHLKPVVQIGQAGLTEGVIAATQVALEQHELLKVSINGESPTERKSGAEELAQATGSHVIQVIGRVILLYRLCEKQVSTPKNTKTAKTVKTGTKAKAKVKAKAKAKKLR